MLKKQNLVRSMAVMLGQGIHPRFTHNSDQFQSFAKIHTSSTPTNSTNVLKSRIIASLGVNSRGCASDFQEIDNLPILKRIAGGSLGGGGGLQKTCEFTLSEPQPILELGLRQEESERRDVAAGTRGDGVFHAGTTSAGFPNGRHSLSGKIAVAVDVDEVLGNFVSALNIFIADRYSSVHSLSEYHVYEFFRIWNCSRDEADIRVHEFFKTHYFKNCIHPMPGARKTLDKLSEFCDLAIVTSRQNAIKDHTIEWIERHFPGLFKEIHFGNHFALDGVSRSKSEMCRSMEAKVLIDDNPRYALECAEVGIKVLLFDYQNSYPWCKTESVDQHPLVTRVHNWEEVEQQLGSFKLS